MPLQPKTSLTPGEVAAIATREDLRRAQGDLDFLSAPQLGATFGSPTLDAYQAQSVWTVADGVTRAVGGVWRPPVAWRAFDVDLVWLNLAAASGDVRLRYDIKQVGAGDTLPAASGTSLTVTASAQDVIAVSTLRSYVVRDLTKPHAIFQVVRSGADALDTLAASIGVLGFQFRRRA